MTSYLLQKTHFQLFSTLHIVTLIICTLITLVVIQKALTMSKSQRRLCEWTIVIAVNTSEWGYCITHGCLPLHFCAVIAVIVVPGALLLKNNICSHILICIGLIACLLAAITPNMNADTCLIEYIGFFTTHSGNILAALYALCIDRVTLSRMTFLKTVVIIWIYIAIVFIIDTLSNQNYIFLIHKPHGNTFFTTMPPWPGYVMEMIISMTLLSYLNFLVIRMIQTRYRKRIISRTL